jgi:hypothetical protein
VNCLKLAPGFWWSRLNTIRGVLERIVSLEELETMFGEYLYETYGGQQSQLLAIDGKTMYGAIPKGKLQGVHLLSAYLAEEGVVVKQVEVKSKENEISAAPELIDGHDLKHKVVCGDAMHTQRHPSVDILAKGGDFIWFLKENQPTLLADVEQISNRHKSLLAGIRLSYHPPRRKRRTKGIDVSKNGP